MKKSNYCKLTVNGEPRMVYKYGFWMAVFYFTMFVSFCGVSFAGVIESSDMPLIFKIINVMFFLIGVPFFIGLMRIIIHWVIYLIRLAIKVIVKLSMVLFVSRNNNISIDENGKINFNKKR